MRRALIGGFIGLLVFVGISWFTNRAPAAKPYPQSAIDAGLVAHCADLQTPEVSPTNAHHPASEITYSQHPATAGDHDPTPLPGQPRIYTTPVVEAQAVHTLEHGSVIMYYRASGEPDGLPKAVLDALGPIATSNPATYLIPYPDLPTGTALALHGVEQARHVSEEHHAGSGDHDRDRVHRFLRVHEQRAGGQERGRLLVSSCVTVQVPPAQAMCPCWNPACTPPPTRSRTRVVGRPSAPPAPPWLR